MIRFFSSSSLRLVVPAVLGATICFAVASAPVMAQQNLPDQTDVPTLKALKKGAKTKPGKNKAAKVEAKADKAEAKGPKPLLVGTYGDWGAYQTTSGKNKVCYALGQPKDRQPSGLQRDAAYIFISRRTAEGVKNEISFGMGFPLKEGASGGSAEVGTSHYELVAKGDNAWVKNAAEEAPLLDTMRKGSRLVVKAPSAKGHITTDSYSLNGLQQAWERVQKDCP